DVGRIVCDAYPGPFPGVEVNRYARIRNVEHVHPERFGGSEAEVEGAVRLQGDGIHCVAAFRDKQQLFLFGVFDDTPQTGFAAAEMLPVVAAAADDAPGCQYAYTAVQCSFYLVVHGLVFYFFSFVDKFGFLRWCPYILKPMVTERVVLLFRSLTGSSRSIPYPPIAYRISKVNRSLKSYEMPTGIAQSYRRMDACTVCAATVCFFSLPFAVAESSTEGWSPTFSASP